MGQKSPKMALEVQYLAFGETFEKKQNMNNLLDKIVRISSEMALQVHILTFKAMQYCASEFAIMSKIYKQHQVCKI